MTTFSNFQILKFSNHKTLFKQKNLSGPAADREIQNQAKQAHSKTVVVTGIPLAP
jgi:hypothetical protein